MLLFSIASSKLFVELYDFFDIDFLDFIFFIELNLLVSFGFYGSNIVEEIVFFFLSVLAFAFLGFYLSVSITLYDFGLICF